MPTAPKTLAQMEKNLTDREIAVRAEAEEQTLPQREQLSLEAPPLMRADAKAKKYWVTILARMEGVQILDDLDSDVLGVYCVMLSRYDRTVADIRSARSTLTKATKKGNEASPEDVEEALGTVAALEKQLQKLESTILQYAEKLGLTPSGRVRLAQKRADAAAQAEEPDGDLFG